MEEEHCKVHFKEGAPNRFSFWILNFKFRFECIIVGFVISFYVVWNFHFWFLIYEIWFHICNMCACAFDFWSCMAFLLFFFICVSIAMWRTLLAHPSHMGSFSAWIALRFTEVLACTSASWGKFLLILFQWWISLLIFLFENCL